MKQAFKSKVPFILIAVVLLWIKTYIVYKTAFNITIESVKQEFILFINPLSFILLIAGIALFFGEKGAKRYLIITSFIISFVLYANAVYYRFFNDFITIPLLFQSGNMSDLGGSITGLMYAADLLMFLDVVILIVLAKWTPAFVSFATWRPKVRKMYFLSIVGIFLFNLGLAETERPQLLTRTFDREILVKNLGTYNYHVYDAVLQSKTRAQRALADGSELAEIQNYINAKYKAPNDDFYGIAEGKNVIVVKMESLQSFVIDQEINGKPVTPFLNEIKDQSYYFSNFFHQTGQGKTSDSEFILDNSLYPVGRGAVFFTHGTNDFHTATPNVLKEKGYNPVVFHANNKSFWNRDVMYDALGYETFYDVDSYDVTEENSVGWGLKDKEFFEQSVPYMKEMDKPFYAKMITLTNHFPFVLDEEDRQVDEFDSNSRTLNRYFPTANYLDQSIKHLFDELKAAGLYENSVIIMYGDHYGISENHNDAMEQYLGKEIRPFENAQLQRVPMIVHIPGVTDKNPKEFDTVSGQVDLKPTIKHLLGMETKNDIQFGEDLFSEDRSDFVVFRDGSFVTDEVIYTKNACYDKESEEEVEQEACEPYMEKAKKELQYSDQIIYGDLLRFYDGTSIQMDQTKIKE
ncbi:phosphoglycerol transferase MdoB-like AlkP superfamily enzyme [Bacillus tianshenii]|uniref:Phosphoglycerol transferase MdoB-like AlkP superfamily enzyme n=1 Tax=Sutcliffiella tianshenii TaxID=1463404 RepID=A0ABS2P0P8_9BACI|nr:LTA synthase family protein [Bacillus tianshenii]MBM7620222.1 phosphoglycerol transferase MdoB-like AlkP superfamily enzyme [Bacillus tianshenii]